MTRIAIVAGALLALCCAWFVLRACAHDFEMCDNDIISEAISADGKTKAVLYGRGCGATTGTSTNVALLAPGGKPTDAGNVFIADGENGIPLGDEKGVLAIAMRWRSGDRLEISYPARCRVFKKEQRVMNVDVEYVEVP